MSIGTIVRLAAIALGIMSAMIMGQQALGARFNEDFLAALRLANDFVGVLITPLELIVVGPALKWLRAFGVEVDLHDHWKHVFVLMWLYIGAYARLQTSLQPGAIRRAFNWGWGGACAFIAGVLAGTAPLSSPSVFWWPVALWCLYYAGNYARTATFERPTDQGWIATFGLTGAALLAATAYCTLVATGVVTSPVLAFATTPSPGLAMLAAWVAAMGAYMLLLLSISRGEDELTLREWFHAPTTQTGIDILSVLGGAAFIVWLGNALA